MGAAEGARDSPARMLCVTVSASMTFIIANDGVLLDKLNGEIGLTRYVQKVCSKGMKERMRGCVEGRGGGG